MDQTAKSDPEITYPFSRRPDSGQALEILDGIWWVRMPLPMALNHINIWLFEDGAGWTLVDTGMGNDQTRQHWEEIFSKELAGRPVTRIIVTHFHPDHLGQAGWLAERCHARLWMTRTEYLMGKSTASESLEALKEAEDRFYHRAGVMKGLGRKPELPRYRDLVTQPPASFRRIKEHETLRIGNRHWRVLVGRGHSPEHACLYAADDRIMISGDQILPRITSNVGVFAGEPDADPLSEWLDSLDRFEELPADTLVLPSHNDPFRGLNRRVQDIKRHHDDRLEALFDACQAQKTAMELVPVLMDGVLNDFNLRFAIGEVIAHLHYLIKEGRIRRMEDSDGILTYEQV